MRIIFFLKPLSLTAVLFLLFAHTATNAHAQGRKLTGRVVDSTDSSPLMGVNVSFRRPEDPNSSVQGATTDREGRFELNISGRQNIEIRVSFVGYGPIIRGVSQAQWTGPELSLGDLRLPRQIGQLSEISVNEWATPVEQKGDTTDIRADSYKVAENSDAEQLVRKMPGITVENGQIQAQGEQVKRVMLDGQEFMGNDATAALRSLPADVVERIQLIDRMSDRAQFTGINDGNTEKTLNIITKTGLDNSKFGKIYAGIGTGSGANESSARYMSGYSVNLFKGKKRVTLLGLANNINQQNFSSQDLSSLSEPDPMPWRTMIGNAMPGGFGRGMMGGGGGAAANFQSGQQGGISETRSLGVNYSDSWDKKGKMSASYF
ncbi:MAG: carboxypeptidase-like regulatory domain-containing protein, partial [Bacteroidota bacterium]